MITTQHGHQGNQTISQIPKEMTQKIKNSIKMQWSRFAAQNI
jgi:hypothetical protein